MRLRDLLSEPAVSEECVLRSTVGFMALHGGSQDRGSDVIARRAAERSGSSFYAIVQEPGIRVHIPSHRHDPMDSEVFGRFLGHVDIVISVHGFGRDSLRLLPDPALGIRVEPYGPALKEGQRGPHRGTILGGRNRQLAARARLHLEQRLPDYRFVDEERWLGPLAGLHPANPVNLPPQAGVQVELPPALRGIGELGELLVPRSDDPEVLGVIGAMTALAADAGRMLGRSQNLDVEAERSGAPSSSPRL
ncbi:MAG TPA: poly-gamma-glutamate hydrolase family protein [Acidimicrobiales bacterium]|nr:poly-gamma-glutamate hydrolase family protein [Acidimicrobiales bacterium]